MMRNYFRASPLTFSVAIMLVFLAACSSPEADEAEEVGEGPTEWDRGLPPTSVLPVVGGMWPARGTIHIHTPYSHDACDGLGYDEETGKIDEDCLEELRFGACKTRQDYLSLTDHPSFMSSQPFEDLFLVRRDEDELVLDEGGSPIAAWWQCDNGHRVLVRVGFEAGLMPIGLSGHTSDDVEERHRLYRSRTVEAVEELREVGGFVVIPHPEGWSIEEIRELEPDGIEFYNMHANIDPTIRGPLLGVPPMEPIEILFEVVFEPDESLVPDVAGLGVIELFDAHLERWHAVSLDRPTLGVAANDAHQNVLSDPTTDGERIDSFRRIMRWFNNYLLLPEGAKPSPETIRDAKRARRSYMAFDVVCTPAGVDLLLEDADGDIVGRMGDLVSLSGADAGDLTIHASMPVCHGGWARAGRKPDVNMTLVRVHGDGGEPVVEVLASGDGDLAVSLPGPGMYYYRVDVMPTHLLNWLGQNRYEYLREVPWVLTNALHVEL